MRLQVSKCTQDCVIQEESVSNRLTCEEFHKTTTQVTAVLFFFFCFCIAPQNNPTVFTQHTCNIQTSFCVQLKKYTFCCPFKLRTCYSLQFSSFFLQHGNCLGRFTVTHMSASSLGSDDTEFVHHGVEFNQAYSHQCIFSASMISFPCQWRLPAFCQTHRCEQACKPQVTSV